LGIWIAGLQLKMLIFMAHLSITIAFSYMQNTFFPIPHQPQYTQSQWIQNYMTSFLFFLVSDDISEVELIHPAIMTLPTLFERGKT
jgi:hypothetical protein